MHEWIVCDGCAVFQSPFMMKTMGKTDHEHPFLRAQFILLQKRSSVSVVLDFNASLNDALPVSPMPFPVDLMRMEKSGLQTDAICVLFLLYSQHTSSSVSVVLDFNASLNDVAPVSPTLLPVDFMRIEKSGSFYVCHVCCFFCVNSTE